MNQGQQQLINYNTNNLFPEVIYKYIIYIFIYI